MHLTSFRAQNIKCFEDVNLELPSDDDGSYAGWNVILGANATGKTTILQAMAATLVGPTVAMRLFSPASWVRLGKKSGRLDVSFIRGALDRATGKPRQTPYDSSFLVTGDAPIKIRGWTETESTASQIILLGDRQSAHYRGLVKGPYATNSRGWMVCGYGAFRRFTGGGEDALIYEPGRAGRVASLFREAVALKRDLDWLPQLYSRSLNLHAHDVQQAKDEYQTVRALLDQLLPEQVQIADVDTQQVYFSAPGASKIDLLDLSDGYRSFLALVMDLLRQITDIFGGLTTVVERDQDGLLRVGADGVVLIDEMDLHLHPTWQREIGPRLLRVFPSLQFIVSSHSPFIAQAAKRNGLFVFHAGDRSAPVRVIRPAPLVSGWTVEQILLSPLFGLTDTRDPETAHLLDEHAKLRGKAKFESLSARDKERLVTIEKRLSERLTAPGELNKEEVDQAVKVAAEKVRRLRDAQARPPQGE